MQWTLRYVPTQPSRTGAGWLYRAVVPDSFRRRVVGWAMADHTRAELVVEVLGPADPNGF